MGLSPVLPIFKSFSFGFDTFSQIQELSASVQKIEFDSIYTLPNAGHCTDTKFFKKLKYESIQVRSSTMIFKLNFNYEVQIY